MEINLRNHFEVLEVLFDAMPFVFWKDRRGVYLGGNLNQAKAFGFQTPAEFIGKNIFELLSDQSVAKKINDTDNEIMSTGDFRSIEETIGEKTYLSQKHPIKDSNGNAIGLIGFAMDITELKKHEILAKKQQEEFNQSVGQMVHDIQSPLSGLRTTVESTREIPEAKRITLRNAAINITDITNQLLHKFKPEGSELTENNKRQPILVSTILSDILSDRRHKYKDLPIAFEYNINAVNAFLFIKAAPSDFRRSISNLINNAVDALPKEGGKVEIKLKANDEWVNVSILDDGKGMSEDLVKKIKQKVAVTEGKDDGHGLGLGQVRGMLEQNYGKFSIFSSTVKMNHGTTVTLEFPRIIEPDWVVEKIELTNDAIVVVLDDDKSIHGAWDSRLNHISEKIPNIEVHHFYTGDEALEFINKLSKKQREEVCFLSDYELINQELNGLEVINKSKLKHSILVTSHHANIEIIKTAVQNNVKILPKELVFAVSFQMVPPKSNELVRVHMVVVDDEKMVARALIAEYYNHLIVDQYSNPFEFLEEVKKYPKDTKFFLDNYYYADDGSPYKIDGLGLAETLHQKGYTRLFLLSGEKFNTPDYLKLILKSDQESIKHLDKL